MTTLQELSQQGAPYSLFVFSMRAENEETRAKFEQMLPSMREMQVGPLDEAEVRELVQSMAGQLPDPAIQEINRLSDGSPFMVSAILRGMVESRTIHREGSHWILDEQKMASVQASDSAANVLLQRIESLPIEEVEILSVAAVSGSVFFRESVASVVDKPAPDLDQHLAKLRKLKLIWQRPDGRLAFAHGKIREIMLSRLSKNDRRPIHLKIAQWYAAESPSQHFQIAYHFHQAGLPEQGLLSAVESAEEARVQFSFDSAEQQFEIAVAGLQRYQEQNKSSHPLAYRVHSGLADTLLLLGRYSDTRMQLNLARQAAKTKLESAWVVSKLGELCFKRGRKARSIPFFQSALKKLGQTIPKRKWQFALHLVKELTIQATHTVFHRRLVHRLQRDPDQTERLILNLYSNLAHAYWYCTAPPAVLLAHLRGMNLAERFNPSLELAQSYSEHGPALTLFTWFSRGLSYVHKSLEIREHLKCRWGCGQSEGYLALVQYAANRLSQSVQHAVTAEKVLDQTGDLWETNIARYHIAASKYYLGELDEAVETSRDTFQSALAIQDYQSTGNILDVWARASGGNVSMDLIKQEQQRKVVDFQRDCHLLLAEGVCLIKEERFDDAALCFQNGISISKKKGIVNAYTMPCYTWLLTAKRLRIEQRIRSGGIAERSEIKKLYRSALCTLVLAKRYRNELPRIYHELGLLLDLLNNGKRCRRMLELGINVARIGGCGAELVSLRETYHRFGKKHLWFDHNGGQYLNPIDGADTNSEENETTFSLVDQFDTLLESGRQILAAENAESIIELTRNSAIKLLRAQTGIVLEPCSERWGSAGNSELSIEIPVSYTHLTLPTKA